MKLVSIIVPIHNATPYLEECVRSVTSQSYHDWELILVDDGSTDKSREQASRFAEADRRISVHWHPGNENLGPSRTRQRGVEAAKGDYICFLDADDCLLDQKLERQVSVMERNVRCVLSHTGIRRRLENPNLETFHPEVHINRMAQTLGRYSFHDLPSCFQSNPICNSTTMVRREAIADLEFGYPQSFQTEDWVLWLLLAEQGEFIAIPESLTDYRVHDAQWMQRHRDRHGLLWNQLRRETLEIFITKSVVAENRATAYQELDIIDKRIENLKSLSSVGECAFSAFRVLPAKLMKQILKAAKH